MKCASPWLTCCQNDADKTDALLQDSPTDFSASAEEQVAVSAIDQPEIEVEGGARYKGQWRDQKRHGQGVLTGPSGQRYEGSFSNGRAHGQGTFIAANGNKYEGQWNMDRAHGYGKYTHIDGIHC